MLAGIAHARALPMRGKGQMSCAILARQFVPTRGEKVARPSTSIVSCGPGGQGTTVVNVDNDVEAIIAGCNPSPGTGQRAHSLHPPSDGHAGLGKKLADGCINPLGSYNVENVDRPSAGLSGYEGRCDNAPLERK